MQTHLEEAVIHLNYILLDLPNSSHCTQPHSVLSNSAKQNKRHAGAQTT